MKRKISFLLLFQSLFTVLQVYLISKISWLGKVGISLAYSEYKFLRSPWKMFLLLMIVQLIVVGLFYFFYRKRSRRHLLRAVGIVAFIALVGLFFTYQDFTHTLSHRLLKEPFHLGFYLFWVGLLINSAFFAVQPMPAAPLEEPAPLP